MRVFDINRCSGGSREEPPGDDVIAIRPDLRSRFHAALDMIVGDPVVGVQKANSSVAFGGGQQSAQPARRAAEIVVRDVEPQMPDRFAIDPLLGKTVSDNNMVDRNRLTPDT